MNLGTLRPATLPWRFLERRWILFLVILTVYVSTANYNFISIDVIAAEVPAWSFATTGQLDLNAISHPALPFFFHHGDGVYSDRFPGAIAFLVPAYWVAALAGVAEFTIIPGSISAAVVTAFAVLVMNEVYGLTLSSRRSVQVATLFTAFGTGAWSLCANAPWSHTLDFLLLALGLWALARGRTIWAGVAFGGVVLTRPQWAVAFVALGLVLSMLERSIRPALKIALGMLPGVVLLTAYNGVLFGRWGPSNGNELGGRIAVQWWEFPVNVLGGLFSPTRGLLFFYPIVLVCAIALPRVFRKAPPWQKAAAVGGTCGIVLQLLLNRYSGGSGFVGSRLWVEPLVLWAPLLAASANQYGADHPRSKVVPILVCGGVLIHGLGAFSFPY